jgi:septin family protein
MGSLLSTKQLTEEEMAEIKQIVEEIIKGSKIAIFSKSYCRKFVKRRSTRFYFILIIN